MVQEELVVLDEDDCMVEIARFFHDFTQKSHVGSVLSVG